MNRSLPAGDCGIGNSPPGRPSGCGRTLPGPGDWSWELRLIEQELGIRAAPPKPKK